MYSHRYQKTVAEPVKFSGIGMHSGKTVNVCIKPAPINHGIKFKRVDLPDQPVLTAHFKMVVDTSLATVIGYNGFIVSTIEHLMASFAGLSVDNALVELDMYEVPIMDGSAEPFTRMIKSAGIVEQEGATCFFVVKDPIELKADGKSVCVYPSDRFKITCTIDFKHPLINRQSLCIEVCDQVFEREICSARTFGFIQDMAYLKQFGFARGGSLDNAVVIDEKKILNKDGLRYSDEFVRHKILDCIGDFSLLGMPIIGHIVLNKSGHAFNHAFLNKFLEQKSSWKTETCLE